MGNFYLPLVDILHGLPMEVLPNWEFRGRSTGGFNSPPLGGSAHHTASGSMSDRDAVNYMTFGSPFAPVANAGIGVDRIFVMAGGATNTSGTGRSLQMPRGIIPANEANTHSFGIEIINAGVGGDPYPQLQIDLFLEAMIRINEYCGNPGWAAFTHNWYTLLDPRNPAGSARKIDPARWSDVQGPWIPQDVGNGAGTWSQSSLVAELQRRAEQGEEDMGELNETGRKQVRAIVRSELKRDRTITWNTKFEFDGREMAYKDIVVATWRMLRAHVGPAVDFRKERPRLVRIENKCDRIVSQNSRLMGALKVVDKSVDELVEDVEDLLEVAVSEPMSEESEV